MRTKTIVGLGLLGVLAGCSGGSGGNATEAPAPPGVPTAPSPSPTATTQEDAGASPAADGGAGRSDAQASPEGGSDAGLVTVNGTVLAAGRGLPYTPVSISGQPPVFTDETGKFEAVGVMAPYDLTVPMYPGGYLVFQGLTTPAPTLALPAAQTNRTATLEGYTPLLFGAGPSIQGIALFHTPTQTQSQTITVSTSGSFGSPNDVRWAGLPQQNVDIYTLEWGNNASGRPSFWPGHTVVQVQDGQATTNVAVIPLSGGATATFGGTVTLPGGYAVQDLFAAWIPDPSSVIGIPFLDDRSGSSSFSLVAPTGTGTVLVSAQSNNIPDGQYSSGSAILPAAGGSPVVVSMPQAPQIILPVNNTSGVKPTDSFSWAGSTGLSQVDFWPAGNGNAPVVSVITEAGSCVFPDLEAFGVTFPKGITYSWSVQEITGVGPHPVDVIATHPNDDLGIPLGAGFAGSYYRTFSTAP